MTTSPDNIITITFPNGTTYTGTADQLGELHPNMSLGTFVGTAVETAPIETSTTEVSSPKQVKVLEVATPVTTAKKETLDIKIANAIEIIQLTGISIVADNILCKYDPKGEWHDPEYLRKTYNATPRPHVDPVVWTVLSKNGKNPDASGERYFAHGAYSNNRPIRNVDEVAKLKGLEGTLAKAISAGYGKKPSGKFAKFWIGEKVGA